MRKKKKTKISKRKERIDITTGGGEKRKERFVRG